MTSEEPTGEENTLDELFSRDPLKITAEEARKLVTFLRERRAQWALSESTRMSQGKKQPNRKAAAPKGVLKDISLDDLMED